MQLLLPPCPECGGERAFFQGAGQPICTTFSHQCLFMGYMPGVQIYGALHPSWRLEAIA